MVVLVPEEGIAEVLHSRECDGVEVALLWSAADNRISVRVVDARAGHAFELPVEDEAPLDVFHHPYAHAAFRGLELPGADADEAGGGVRHRDLSSG
jgi:hypothetical protein